jgi:hypothetical protein
MAQRNELLEAAIEECRRLNLPYRYEQTRNKHIKFYVANSPRIVLIGAAHGTLDIRVRANVKRDVHKSAALINEGK